MDPFWLTFNDKGLEDRYNRQRVLGLTARLDWWFMLVTAATRIAGMIRFRSRLNLTRCWPMLSYMLWNIAELTIRNSMDEGQLCKWRDRLVIISRILHILEVGVESKTITSAFVALGQKDTPISSLSFLFSFGVSFGLLSMATICLGQPLNFMHHMPIQFVSAFFLSRTLGLESCHEIAKIATVWDILCRLVTRIDLMAKLVMEAMYSPIAAVDLSWDVQQPCFQLAFFLQVFAGFGVSSYFVWVLERRSRVHFLQMLPANEKPEDEVVHLSWRIVFAHIPFVIAAFGISWRLILNITSQFQYGCTAA